MIVEGCVWGGGKAILLDVSRDGEDFRSEGELPHEEARSPDAHPVVKVKQREMVRGYIDQRRACSCCIVKIR